MGGRVVTGSLYLNAYIEPISLREMFVLSMLSTKKASRTNWGSGLAHIGGPDEKIMGT